MAAKLDVVPFSNIDDQEQLRMKSSLRQSTFISFVVLVFSGVTVAQDSETWFKQFAWREIGPTATGGRVTDIEVHPDNPHHIFVASAAGGLWETKNNGTTWDCIFERESTTTIGDIAIDPNDAKTIWVGTGEANNQRSSLWGDGIYKSNDGGKTWKNMGLERSQHIGRVIVDPTDSDTVYVAALGALYSANPERGLYRTTNGGKTWKRVLYINPDVGVVDVVVDPQNTSTLFAASYERRRRAWNFDGAGPGSAIYKSTDGGDNWKKLEGGLPSGEIGRIGLDIYAKDSKILYATVSNQNPAPPRTTQQRGRQGRSQVNPADKNMTEADKAAMGFFGLSGSDEDPDTVETALGLTLDFSKPEVTVKKVSAGSTAQRQGVRAGDVLISAGGVSAENAAALRELLNSLKPGDQMDIVIQQDQARRPIQLAVPMARAPRQIGGEIYRSEDGGETWKKMNKSPVGGSPAYYYGQIRIDPNDDSRIYVLSVPVFVSSDKGATFKSNGAPSVHVDHHALWINPRNSNHVMLGNDGGFHVSYDQSKTWDYVFNLPLAQFYAIAVDMQQPYHVYGGLQDNGSWGGPSKSSSGVGRQDWYRVSGGDGFYVQVDPDDHNIIISESQFGAIGRLNRETGQRRSIRPPQSGGSPNRYNWNSPILMSTHDSRVVYFGGNKLFKSFNRGDDWLTISPDLTTADPAKISGNVPHCTLTTIAESKLDRNLLMVGTDDGKVQITDDGGKSWNDLSENFPYRPRNWWCSRVEFSHADRNTAYASFTGYREDDFRPFVFKTNDAGKTWTSIAANLPDAPVNVIKQDPVNPTTLYLGTEFAAYVSLDDGKNWHDLNENLPRVSVQDLVVHPRDNDLVIGTHGRGIYVLDHIKPLQKFTPELVDKASHLFEVDDWMPTPRASSGGFAGDRKRIASRPNAGASIWYHLKDDVDVEEISMTVFNSDGKEMAKLKLENKAGLHRAFFPAQSGSNGRRRRFRRSAAVQPGTYKVVMTVGSESQEQSFEIKSQ
jgi:photosystem II stability/assembly factor-like uncharacterized protein